MRPKEIRFEQEFYEIVTDNIADVLSSQSTNQNNQQSITIEIVLKIIFNTLKCFTIFYPSDHPPSMFDRKLKTIIENDRISERLIDSRIKLNQGLSKNSNAFKINSFVDLDAFQEQNAFVFTQKSIDDWIFSLNSKCFPMIRNLFRKSKTIVDLFNEIDLCERKFLEGSKFQKWAEFKVMLDIEKTFWNGWFLAAFEERVYDIVQEKIDSIIVDLVLMLQSFQESLQQTNELSILEFVWHRPQQQNQNYKPINAFCLMITKLLDLIDTALRKLYEDLVVFEKKHHKFLVKIYDTIENFFIEIKNRIDSFQSYGDEINDPVIGNKFKLLGAIFLQKILETNNSLHLIFSIGRNNISLDIRDHKRIEERIRSISESYLIIWFDTIISKNFQSMRSLEISDPCNFLQILSRWQSIEILLENDENEENTNLMSAENLQSAVEVPVQISLKTFEILQKICTDMNHYCGHIINQKVLWHILNEIFKNFIELYNGFIDRIEKIGQSMRQIISIQLYFDSIFMKKILLRSKNETLRLKYLEELNVMMKNLESNIDPFDMHLIHPHLESNSEQLQESLQISFGFLFLKKASFFTSAKQSTDGKSSLESSKFESTPNSMLINNCQFEFNKY